MVRSRLPAEQTPLGSPHVRGDGPVTPLKLPAGKAFSPRAWGWSVPYCGRLLRQQVLPTCVGMVHRRRYDQVPSCRSPHVCGDGPQVDSPQVQKDKFSTCVGMVRCSIATTPVTVCSPHVRGDGPSPGPTGRRAGCVLPTCVGMVRIVSGPCATRFRSPHVRGDGPTKHGTAWDMNRFSPRAWGWSGAGPAGPVTPVVLPTCVGMVRRITRIIGRA